MRVLFFDGTMQWKPFIDQCVMIVRDSMNNYKTSADVCDVTSGNQGQYFAKIGKRRRKKNYRTILFAVTVDPDIAVCRAMLRQIGKGREVSIRALLASHKRFAKHFSHYKEMFDEVFLLDNNTPRFVKVKKIGDDISEIWHTRKTED